MFKMNNKCRLCLNFSELQISLFGEYSIRNDILFKINKCLPNKIVKNGSNSMICYKCLYSLELSYNFWKQCHDTELIVNANIYAEQATNQINIIDSDDEEYAHCNYNLLPKGKPMEICGPNEVYDCTKTNTNNWKSSETTNRQMIQNAQQHSVLKSLPAPPTPEQPIFQNASNSVTKMLSLKAAPAPPSSLASFSGQQMYQNCQNSVTQIFPLQEPPPTSPNTTFAEPQIDPSEHASFSRLVRYFGQNYPTHEASVVDPKPTPHSPQAQAQQQQQQQQQIPNDGQKNLSSNFIQLSPQKDLIDKFRFWKAPNNMQKTN